MVKKIYNVPQNFFFPVGGLHQKEKKMGGGRKTMLPKFPFFTSHVAYGHTTGNTPEPVRFQKLSLVRLVLRWATTWEHWVLYAFSPPPPQKIINSFFFQ
jgi:hypothetical protein